MPSLDPIKRDSVTSQNSRRHSTSSVISKAESTSLKFRRPASCISVVTESPEGDLSVEVVQNSQKDLSAIPETPETPGKKYFSIRTNPFKDTPFITFGNGRATGSFKKRSLFEGLREKIGLLNPNKFQSSRDKTFEKICFELARADESEAGLETAQIFETHELNLKIETINGKTFSLVLPPSLDLDSHIVGDQEEGIGGSCDLFIGMLPTSCRKVSEKASPLGLVPRLLPHGVIGKEARYVGSCFWIWLCIVDGKLDLPIL